MLVVFAGTHLPLVAMVLYLLLVSPGGLGAHLVVLAALLIATLLGFVATLFALRALLAPLRLACSSLEVDLVHDQATSWGMDRCSSWVQPKTSQTLSASS